MDLVNLKIPLSGRKLDERKDYVATIYVNEVKLITVDTKIGEKRIRQDGNNLVISFAKTANHRIYPDHVRVEVLEVEKGSKNTMMPAAVFLQQYFVYNEAIKVRKSDTTIELWNDKTETFEHEGQFFVDDDEEEEDNSDEEEEENSDDEESSKDSSDSAPKTAGKTPVAKKSSRPKKGG
jgi:hypothetical protein